MNKECNIKVSRTEQLSFHCFLHSRKTDKKEKRNNKQKKNKNFSSFPKKIGFIREKKDLSKSAKHPKQTTKDSL